MPMKKLYIFFIIMIVLAVLLFGLKVYVNRVLIPVKLRAIIVKSIQDITKQEAEIDTLSFGFTRGFVFKGVRIYDGPKENNAFLFSAERINFGVVIVPSFKKIAVMIPSVNIKKPYLSIKRFEDGSINLQKLIPQQGAPQKPSKVAVSLGGFSFAGGEISFEDNSNGIGFRKNISSLDGNVGLSLPNSIKADISARIDDCSLKMNGRYRLTDKKIDLDTSVSGFPLPFYWESYISKMLSAGKEPAQKDIYEKIKVSSGTCDILLTLDMSGLSKTKIKTDMRIKGLDSSFDKFSLKGDYALSGTAEMDTKDTQSLLYNMQLGLSECAVGTGVETVGNIEKINGLVHMTQKQWDTQALKCIAFGSPVELSLKLEEPHKDYKADAGIMTTLPLINIAKIAKLDIESGAAEINAKLSYKKDKSFTAGGSAKIDGLKLVQDGTAVAGNFSIDAESSGIADKPDTLDYKGTALFDKVSVSSPVLFSGISDMNGEAAFLKNKIEIKKLTALAAETQVYLKGVIEMIDKVPHFDFNVKTDEMAISKVITKIPAQYKEKLGDIKPDGLCTIDIDIKGAAGKPETYSYTGRLDLKKGSIEMPYEPKKISDISCNVIFDKQKVTWKDLYLTARDIRYNSEGELTDFTSPSVKAVVRSDVMLLNADARMDQKKSLTISRFDGKYYNTTFDLKGTVNDLQSLYADLEGTIGLDLKNLPDILAAKKAELLKLQPEGLVNITFAANGPLKDEKNLTASIQANSGAISLQGLHFTSFYLDYRVKDGIADVPVLTASCYDGIINVDSRTNLRAEGRPYLANIDIKDIDLNKLAQDTKTKDKNLEGILTAKCTLNGFLDQKDSLKGTGWLQLAKGHLWEMPLVRTMWEYIKMIPPEYVTFTDAFGNFTIRDNRVYTEDFTMVTQRASMLWAGSIGFDQTLDLTVTGRFAKEVALQTTEAGKIEGATLNEAGDLVIPFGLEGTIQKPKPTMKPLIKTIQDKVFKGLKDLFGKD